MSPMIRILTEMGNKVEGLSPAATRSDAIGAVMSFGGDSKKEGRNQIVILTK